MRRGIIFHVGLGGTLETPRYFRIRPIRWYHWISPWWWKKARELQNLLDWDFHRRLLPDEHYQEIWGSAWYTFRELDRMENREKMLRDLRFSEKGIVKVWPI